MFKQQSFHIKLAEALDVSFSACTKLFNLIYSTYSDPIRHYHNVDHILEMFNVLKKSGLYDQASLLAVFFHDIVYDVNSRDNEHMSSDVCCDSLLEFGISPNVADRARFLIQLTADHIAPPGDELAAAFLDADMAILGSQPFHYVDYSYDIAAEYSTFPNYIAERIKFLESLLERDHIYHTPYFRALFAKQAIENITNELRFLNDRK